MELLKDGEVSVIILCHTLELAQIENEYLRFTKYMPDVLVVTFFGGTPDAELLKDIIVATSGLNALVQDKVLDEMVREEVSC